MPQMSPITLTPIGEVQNDIHKPADRGEAKRNPDLKRKEQKAFHERVKETVSRLVIDAPYEPLLEGIEAFSHIVVLYWPHLLPEKERQIQKVHPMGWSDLPEQGVFATRTPTRPNPVLISTVRLIGRENNILHVKGLEALNGSPLIDIKPYIALDETDGEPLFPEWIKKLHDEMRSS